nr:MAG TPA: hypothetical protein [Bacteriophage sp.]DAR11168.1 MAG TPA: hypothetical protein [Bacteriophage sp.]DAX03026.1 MAG TPA: hypothetical protein [Bacteriophage sp.]
MPRSGILQLKRYYRLQIDCSRYPKTVIGRGL